MKALKVMIDEELMQNAKIFAIQQNITLKELVSLAVSHYIGNTATSATSNTANTKEETPNNAQKTLPSQPKSDNIVVVEEPKPIYDPEKHFLIRKTHRKELMKSNVNYTKYGLDWYIMCDCYVHYDKNGEIIPCRYTSWDGITYEPDEGEIRTIEENTGKKVIFE